MIFININYFLFLFSKRRTYNSSETRDECIVHNSKQASLYGSMKEEPINKKLMELAEGKLSITREKSTDTFQKKTILKEKSETKEIVTSDSKRTCIDESLQTLHTESDLSDISDDPDDILNMEDITVRSIYLIEYLIEFILRIYIKIFKTNIYRI